MKISIKATAIASLLALSASMLFSSCAGHDRRGDRRDGRQDNRVDRRDGRQDNRDGRQDNRQDNRDGRQDNRQNN